MKKEPNFSDISLMASATALPSYTSTNLSSSPDNYTDDFIIDFSNDSYNYNDWVDSDPMLMAYAIFGFFFPFFFKYYFISLYLTRILGTQNIIPSPRWMDIK